MNTIELLAPAKDLECGTVAIDCGADAVYIGAPRFGAREAAGNTLEDIAALAAHAHKYWARVYATVNTLLREDEIGPALRMIRELERAGVDGLIVQDVGLLECELPALALIASTQMNNATPEKVAFLEQVGFRRAILARELNLDQIRAIRAAAPTIELECFIHGSLCVGASGQCYLSYALGGRSGNRGACAQPCRRPYTLVDGEGRELERERHLLSLRDLNLSGRLEDLLDAGVSSFKIEGRLKDAAYVANIVSYYRGRLDETLKARGLRRSSAGNSTVEFTPDPAKTFNRGYTEYFIAGRGPARETVASPATPKMVGEELGRVTAVDRRGVTLDTQATLHPGDGVCFFDAAGCLRGSSVNAVHGTTFVPERPEGFAAGITVYRNHDHEFLTQVKRSRKERRIGVTLRLREAAGGLTLAAEDTNGVRAEFTLDCALAAAAKPEAALDAMRRQLAKTGGTEFACTELTIELERAVFVPVSELNALRRGALEALTRARAQWRPRVVGCIERNNVPYPERELTYLGNVLNRRAEAFYRRHGVTRIEPAAETGMDLRGKKVMTTRACVKHSQGMCPRDGGGARGKAAAEPWRLIDEEGRRLALHFHCDRCEMEIFLES